MGYAGWQLIATFTQLFEKYLHPGPAQDTALPFHASLSLCCSLSSNHLDSIASAKVNVLTGSFCILLFMNPCSCRTKTIITAFLDLWLIVLAEEKNKKNQQKREGAKSDILEIKITSCLLLLKLFPLGQSPYACTCAHIASSTPQCLG